MTIHPGRGCTELCATCKHCNCQCNIHFSLCFTRQYKVIRRENLAIDQSFRAFFLGITLNIIIDTWNRSYPIKGNHPRYFCHVYTCQDYAYMYLCFYTVGRDKQYGKFSLVLWTQHSTIMEWSAGKKNLPL